MSVTTRSTRPARARPPLGARVLPPKTLRLGPTQAVSGQRLDAWERSRSDSRQMELLTLKPLRHGDSIDLEVVALDDSGVTVTYTAQLTKDLSDILSVSPDEASPMTSDLIDFVRAEARAYIKSNGAGLAGMLK
jgi:hypothetical protein